MFSYHKKEKGEVRPNSRGGACFKCGELGHRAADCWSQGGQPRTQVASPMNPPREGKQFTCFTCRTPGHKANECPQRKLTKGNRTIKRIEIGPDELEGLQHNEVVGQIEDAIFPITLDSGAAMSIMPIECIPPECISKENKMAR